MKMASTCTMSSDSKATMKGQNGAEYLLQGKGSKDDGLDDVIDVVNVSISNETPTKNPSRMGSIPASTSTPDTNRHYGGHFSPVCSPIAGTLLRPGPSVSPDSSGYGSSSPQSSSGSRTGSSGLSGCYVTTPNRESQTSSSVDMYYKQRLQVTESLPSVPSQRHHSPPGGSANRGDNHCMKNVRTTYTSAQVRILERSFSKDQYPEPDTIEELSREINVPCNKIKVWFQNRRARIRRRVNFPIPHYAMAAYAPGMQATSGARVPGMPPMPPAHQVHPAMPVAMLPPGIPGASMAQTGTLASYPGYYHNMLPAIPPMFPSQCTFPQSMPYPDFGLYSYPLPGLPRLPHQSSHNEGLTESDSSHLLYYPQPTSAVYQSC